jgi:hypothetical protein
MQPLHGNEEERLDALFRAYRQACPTPEPSANFMPEIWQRIEARQTVTFSFRRMANALATAALALSIALSVYMALPSSNPTAYQSYVEALAEANPLDAPDIVVHASLDLSDAGR